MPIGAYARIEGQILMIDAMVGSLNGQEVIRDSIRQAN